GRIGGWRDAILANGELYEKIRRKYRMKNTVGYSLNAFIDHEHPLDILAHLMVGAEGTLGFIIDATLHTIPDLPEKAATMLYFPGIYDACAAIPELKHSGAEALELMDRNALRSVEHMPGLPAFFKDLPEGAAALLCEYQAQDRAALDQLLQKAQHVFDRLPLLHAADITKNEYQRQFYWKIRKGMFPSVGAVRQRGTTVLLEDIAFPVPSLADALVDLRSLFAEFGYDNAIIFGHAKEGNIHFVLTQLLDRDEEIDRYDRFIRKVADLVVSKYDGALKAEHGTGRNMAPFVEMEWGGAAYEIMRSLKQAVDPDDLLNPGVIINADPNAHIKDLKQMPQVEEEVDKCIECGFCEHHCPSRDVTLTPRQRIQVRRHLRQFEARGDRRSYDELLEQYQYAGLDTCATDGLCQVDCPVSINTGDLVKRLRKEQHGKFSKAMAMGVARQFALVESMLRVLLRTGVFANRWFGRNFMAKLTGAIHKLIPAMPMWWNELPVPPQAISNMPNDPQYVYLSACIQRMMGNDEQMGGLQQAMITLCQRAGIDVLLPPSLTGHCCGQAFSSKGYFDAARHKQEQLVDALWNWTKQGALP
ncbi:MAG TPA: FAD-linked oxidase C-terminal domain-containing protein, partial [Phnomibacter sp.]|nr:FAD-linked oxidase C-terminal domain-containing protein [Phnomibacter sp.]